MNAINYNEFAPTDIVERIIFEKEGQAGVERMRQELAHVDRVIEEGRRAGNVLLAIGRAFPRNDPSRRFALNRACSHELASQA